MSAVLQVKFLIKFNMVLFCNNEIRRENDFLSVFVKIDKSFAFNASSVSKFSTYLL